MFRNTAKLKLKIAHASLHAAAVVFISLGLAVEFIQHSYHGERELYSLHSWVGMATVVVFVSQFVFGFVCYLFPALNEKIKAFYLPVHVFFGIACFIMAIATCLIGFNQNARFNMRYQDLPPEGVLINCIGLMMIAFGFLVVYIVTSSAFERPLVVS